MSANTITEMISELSRITITDDKVAWQVKLLINKLCLLEELYDVFVSGHSGLSREEQERYQNEVFPSLLRHCHKMADYFSICPEIRCNEQNDGILESCFARYNKIIERLLTKLQKANSPQKQTLWFKAKMWFIELGMNLFELNKSIDATMNRFFARIFIHVPTPAVIFGRKSIVMYHRDSIDYVGCGYSLQPLQSLNV